MNVSPAAVCLCALLKMGVHACVALLTCAQQESRKYVAHAICEDDMKRNFVLPRGGVRMCVGGWLTPAATTHLPIGDG